MATAVTVALGFTVMVKVDGAPAQLTPPLVYVGDTVMVAVTGAVVAFAAVKLGRLPVPLAAKPMEVVLFVQAYVIVPPVVGLPKATAVEAEPVQTT